MNKLFILLFLCCYTPFAYTQFSRQDLDRAGGHLKKEVLGKGFVRCVYEATQAYTNKDTKQAGHYTDTLTLDIGKDRSCYYNRNGIAKDSLNAIKRDALLKSHSVKVITPSTPTEKFMSLKEGGGEYIESKTSGKEKVYKDRKKQEVVTTNMKGTLYVFKCTEKTPPQQWKITNDTLTVLGYVCQKATTSFRGRKYDAWFTDEIPLNDGPWKLYGLPGLILKAETEDQLFSFTAIGLENINGNADITMDKDDYIKSDRQQMQKVHDENMTTTQLNYFKDGHLYSGFRQEPWIFEPMELE